MPHDVISTCPVCASELAVTRLHCRSCGTTLEGDFSVGRFGRLNREQLTLLESFLRSRGNLREMERELGISYPTVRSRVEALVRALGFGPRADADDAEETPAGSAVTGRTREEILEAVARHEMSAEEAADRDPCAREDRAMTAATDRLEPRPPHRCRRHRLASASATATSALRAVDGDDAARPRAGRTGPRRAASTIELGDRQRCSTARSRRRPASARGGTTRASRSSCRHRATVVVETDSAEIEADGLVGDQRYRTTSGDIDPARASAGRIAVEAVSGDLDIRRHRRGATSSPGRCRATSSSAPATLRSLDLATTSGDLKLAGRLAGTGPFAIETVSGDGLLAPAGDVRIEMTTMSGDLQLELDDRVQGGRGHRSLVGRDGRPVADVPLDVR